jgi:hypothetical protein
MSYCTRCGKETEWTSKSGYCKNCAADVLKTRQQSRPKNPVLIAVVSLLGVAAIIFAVSLSLGEPATAAPTPHEADPELTTAQKMDMLATELMLLWETAPDETIDIVFNDTELELQITILNHGLTRDILAEGLKSLEGRQAWQDVKDSYESASAKTLAAVNAEDVWDVDAVVSFVDSDDPTITFLQTRNGVLEYDISEELYVDVLDGAIESVSGSGSGDIIVSTAIASESRLCKINFTHDGEGNFVVRDFTADGDLIINEIGAWNGTYLFTPGSHSYEITADGNWTYSVDTIDKGARSGASGTRDGVSGWFDSVEASSVSFVHSGEGNFVVWLYCPDTEESELIVNEIGRYKGEKYVEFDPNIRYIWIVTADGNWSISIDQ